MLPDDVSQLIVSSLNPNETPLALTAPDGPRQPHLVLHLDINETILLGDPAGNDTVQHSANKMLAKVAFCRRQSGDCGEVENQFGNEYDDTTKLEPTTWWDGQKIGEESSVPPLYTGWEWPPGCVPYYRTRYKSMSKSFADAQHQHGKIYHDLLARCQEEIGLKGKPESDCVILPALYQTLSHQIKQRGESLTVVFRTLGSDLSKIAKAVNGFARKEGHSQLILPDENLFQGRWKSDETSGSMIYQLWNLDQTKLVASGDDEVLRLLHGARTEGPSIFGIRDSYNDWASNAWHPSSGKPVWVPRPSEGFHHILFDDNIHNLPDDGIACIREQRLDGSFVTLDHTQMQGYYGVHLVRVPTVEVVLNPSFFNEMIDRAEAKFWKVYGD